MPFTVLIAGATSGGVVTTTEKCIEHELETLFDHPLERLLIHDHQVDAQWDGRYRVSLFPVAEVTCHEGERVLWRRGSRHSRAASTAQ